MKILDEYTDRERRKANIIIHNLPESTLEKGPDKIADDIKRADEMLQYDVNMSDVKITKVIRLGGRGQNKQNKPRLILATLNNPDRRRAILAAARTLRHTDDWANIYISPDVTPLEREKEKKLREELKTWRNAGESNLIIKGDKLVTKTVRKEQANSQPEYGNVVNTTDEQLGKVSNSNEVSNSQRQENFKDSGYKCRHTHKQHDGTSTGCYRHESRYNFCHRD